MEKSEEKITRDHELYLRHLLLLGQAAPLVLKAFIEKEVSKRQAVNLARLMSEKKDTFKDHYKAEFLQLFQDDEVSTNIDLWDTLLLCVVTLVLFKSCLTATECEAIACVSNQRKDLDNYAHSASLSYNTFETKWHTLHSAMLTLIDDIDGEANFKCKRMIHSFKSEPIIVNIELINRMKQMKDVNLHIQMAIQAKVVPKIHGAQEVSCDKNERTDHQYDSPVFTENLQDTFVYINEPAILTCKLNVSEKAVIWQQESEPVEETDTLMVGNKNEMHWLAISRAKLTDRGNYSCVCGNTSTEAFLEVSEKPLKIVENLHVANIEANVRVNEDIVLRCSVDRHANKPVWRHNGNEIKPCDRRHISVQKLEHRLTIRNATLADQGDYTFDCGDATSSITLTIKGLNTRYTSAIHVKTNRHSDNVQNKDKTQTKSNKKPLKIVENLHIANKEANVRVNEDIVLSCSVDRHTNEYVWRHDGNEIKHCDRRHISVHNLEHRLTIRNTNLADQGDYTFDCADATSSTKLTVKEKPLKIVENLHVANIEANVRVNEDIVLSCSVDRHANKPVWRHNGNDIKPCDRRHISVHKLEYRLTIRNATLADQGDYTFDCGDATSSTKLTVKDPPEFTENLRNTFVNVGESTILACKLNGPEIAVKWEHNYQTVQQTDNVKLVTDKCTHWLVISNAMLTDSGHYSCSCGNRSTTASLRVSDTHLTITKGLHVATKEADIQEKMDIVLKCAVNIPTNKVIWRHEGKKIILSIRHVVSVQDLEHKLTIMNAKFEDEGDYTVAFGEVITSANLTIKGNLNLLHKKQLTENLFKNWIRGALGLKYLKLGLEEFANDSVNSHHVEIMKGLPHVGNVCTTCTADFLLPSHKQGICPNKSKCLCSKQPKQRKLCINGGFCSTVYDRILWDHRFYDPLLTNTDVSNWSKEPWSVATCYISTTGYQGKLSAKDVDCSGLLSLFINNTFIHRRLGDVEINGETDLFKQAKEVRNDILHNANYELSEGQINDCIDLFKSVLEIKDDNGDSPLSAQPCVQDAINNLDELRNYQIDVRMTKDFQKQIEYLNEIAMNDLAKEVGKAEMRNRTKLQQLTEELKHTERNLQIMRDLRTAEAETKDSEVPFELELHIQAHGPTGETSIEGNRRIYQSMKDYVVSQNSKTYKTSINSTDQSVHRLLDFIIIIKDCNIVTVMKTDTYAYIKIYCLTCEAIKEFLKLINGNKFRTETTELRKSLEMQEHIKTDDIIVSCSSESIDNTKKRLYNRVPTNGSSCGKHQGTQCTWYCSDHDKFCCSACKDSDHSACVGIMQVVSERSYGISKQTLTFKRKVGKYNVQIKHLLRNRGDNDEDACDITSICMLPYGNILLVDRSNHRLKKLDSLYNVVSHCDILFIPNTPYNACYIGDDRAAVCLFMNILFVNVSGSIKTEQLIGLDHPCYALACHGDTLYVRGTDTIYTYNRDCQQKHLLYREQYLIANPNINGIAVSDDGERIYIACRTKGLITIDEKGNHLFVLLSYRLWNCIDVCVVGDGTVLALNKAGRVLQVDYSGEQILGTLVNELDDLECTVTMCYDRNKFRLIADVANAEGEYVTVFELKYDSSGT